MGSSRKLLVGVDEAGYGPNLGPLVVAAAWVQVPADTASSTLWDRLAPVVARHPASDPASLIIDDSKRVYSGGRGRDHLERAALAWIASRGRLPATLRELWAAHCLTPAGDLDEIPCYADQDVALPRHAPSDDLDGLRQNLSDALARASFQNVGLACQIVMPRRFNDLLRRRESKAAALFQVNAELLRHVWESSAADAIEVILDKHGGRNFYRALLQQEFHESVVWAGRESAAASHYTLTAGGRRLDATFLPRADSQHLLVALASMTAKYLRELWMELFNSFWTSRVPGLEPTAGYPVDARRFWRRIEPEIRQLGIAKELLWRAR